MLYRAYDGLIADALFDAEVDHGGGHGAEKDEAGVLHLSNGEGQTTEGCEDHLVAHGAAQHHLDQHGQMIIEKRIAVDDRRE